MVARGQGIGVGEMRFLKKHLFIAPVTVCCGSFRDLDELSRSFTIRGPRASHYHHYPLSLFPFFAASPTAPSAGLHPHEVLSSRLLASRTETIFQKMIGCPSPHCAVGPVFRTTSPHLSPAQLPFSNLCTMFRIFFMPLCN